MRTLVTGGTGFIGANIVRSLLETGDQVLVMDARPPDELLAGYLRPHGGRATFLAGNLLDVRFILDAGAAHPVDRVVHAAAFSVPRLPIERGHARDIVEVNVMGTANVCELARVLSVRRLVYVSTGAVYGSTRDPSHRVTEEDLCRPERLYGITKYAGELVSLRYGAAFGFDARVARIGGPYGPMERRSDYRQYLSPIHDWTDAAMSGTSISVPDLEAIMATTHVRDIADGIVAVLEAPAPSHAVYNVSTREEHPVRDVLVMLQQLEPRCVFSEDRSLDWRGMLNYALGRQPDVARLYDDLGFRPRYDLEAGLADYIRWRHEHQHFQ